MDQFPQPKSLRARPIAGCADCPRLAAFLADLREERPHWWNRPVPGFGDPAAKLLILGLAPGKGGANRTGRPFTGDAAGTWLFKGLADQGLCSRATVESRTDGTSLAGVYITNAVKCVPPQNKPVAAEIKTCRPHLEKELALLREVAAILVLGRVSYNALAALNGEKESYPSFGHGSQGEFVWRRRRLALVCSYHPSRQNTNTGRLTPAMWQAVLSQAREQAGL